MTEYIIHFANILYLISYLVKDILWLRLITIVAIFSLIPYFYVQPKPLYAAIAWNLLFAVINIYQVYLLFKERRPVFLTEKEENLRQMAFSSMDQRQFKKLIAVGKWDILSADDRIIEEGQIAEHLMVLVEGKAKVEKGERLLANVGAGQFVGEMSYMTKEKTMADVTVETDALVFKFPCDPLNEVLDKNPEIRAALQNIIGNDLVNKLAA